MYRQFAQALDADGGHVAATLSEVDVTDPENIRAIFDGAARNPMVSFGDTDFLVRYRAYQAHLAEWLQQYPGLRSVDMRYGRQVVLDIGTSSASGAQTVAPQNIAPSPITPQTDEAASASHTVSSTPKVETKTKARHKGTPGRHSSKAHKPTHERGHTVRDPIAHVVSGM